MRKLGRRSVLVAALLLLACSLAVLGRDSLGLGAGKVVAMAQAKTSGKDVATPVAHTPTVRPPEPTPIPTLAPTPTPDGPVAAPANLKAKLEPPAASVKGPAVQLPARLSIPSIGVDTGFEFVGQTADGAMDVPRDASKVAWYKLGPRPGEVGNAIVAGHVDWGGKTAVFWRLQELHAGDPVEIVGADDRSYQFMVQWQKWYDASSSAMEEIFGQSNVKEVTLITCGGPFDRQSRQYLSRLVVRGVLR